MSEAKKLLEECKQILGEIKNLISVLEAMPPDEVLKKIKDLPSKEKAVLLDMINRGDITQQVTSAREKNPTYIL